MTVLPFPTKAQDESALDADFDPDDWHASAECTRTDPEAFFAEDAHTTDFAKRVCAECPVRVLCLSEALKQASDGDRVWGVWGGLEERDRKKLTHAERHTIHARASSILAAAA